MDYPNPLFGSQTSIVELLDRGVEWKMDRRLRLYEESFLELGDAATSSISDTPAPPEVKPLYTNRLIAGFAATAYQINYPEGPPLILWIAPSTEILAEAGKEIHNYQTAYLKRLLEKSKTTQLTELQDEVKLVALFIRPDLLPRLKNVKSLPKGFLLAMELYHDKRLEAKTETLFEIQNIQTMAAQPDTFILPSGFKQVNSLMEAQLRGMTGN